MDTKKQQFGLLASGIFLGALLPVGIYYLTSYIIEKILIDFNFHNIYSLVIATFIGIISNIIVFKKVIKYLNKNDFSKPANIKKLLKISIRLSILISVLWFILPLIHGYYLENYLQKLNESQSKSYDNLILRKTVRTIGSATSFFSIVFMVYKQLKTKDKNSA